MFANLIAFLSQPLVIPVYAALVAVLLTFLAQWIREFKKHSSARNAAFSILYRELGVHKEMFSGLQLQLSGNFVHPTIDAYSVKNFLDSSYPDLTKDAALISKLQGHLLNISTLNAAIGRIDMASVGFTTVHTDKKRSLEESLKKALKGMTEDVDACLALIPKSNRPDSH